MTEMEERAWLRYLCSDGWVRLSRPFMFLS